MSAPETQPSAPASKTWIRTLVDFGALAAFIIGYLIFRDLERATWVLVIGSAVALVIGFAVERRLAPMPAIAGGFALVFGVLTIVLHNEDIIKVKVTVMNGALAAVLLGGLLFGKNPVKLLFGEALKMSERAWRTLTVRYGLYFAICAVANEIVWRTQSNDFWVLTFRPALWVSALIFACLQFPLIMREMKAAEAPPPESPDPLP